MMSGEYWTGANYENRVKNQVTFIGCRKCNHHSCCYDHYWYLADWDLF